jgi:hypothetical protein
MRRSARLRKFVALRQVVHRNDVVDAAGVQALDDVAANKAGRAGYNYGSCHANNSS